jgi:hypothetical protein
LARIACRRVPLACALFALPGRAHATPSTMTDIILVLVTVVFFAISIAYTIACDRI